MSRRRPCTVGQVGVPEQACAPEPERLPSARVQQPVGKPGTGAGPVRTELSVSDAWVELLHGPTSKHRWRTALLRLTLEYMHLGSENRRLSNEVCGLRAEIERLTDLGDQVGEPAPARVPMERAQGLVGERDQMRTDDAICTHGGPDVVDPR